MNECYLKHHGVKGMKWGVIRRRKELTKTKPLPRETKDMITSKKLYKRQEEKAVKFINRLSEKHPSLGINNARTMSQMMAGQQAVQIAIQNANRTASLGLSGGTNPFMFG